MLPTLASLVLLLAPTAPPTEQQAGTGPEP
jgi:hypothetical protein